MGGKLEDLKSKLDTIQDRVIGMCKDVCERNGLDYDKEFGSVDVRNEMLKEKLDSIQDRTEDICKEVCDKKGIDFDEEFGDVNSSSDECEKSDENEYRDEDEEAVELTVEPPAEVEDVDDEENDVVSDEEKEKNGEYVSEFKKELGYKEDYFPSNGYYDVADSVAREYTLEMPTDTEAQETEGDAVMLLVSSCSKKAVKAGKKLGDIMMKKSEGGNGKDNENLLEAMRDAYLELRSLGSKEESEKYDGLESIGAHLLYDSAKMIFESRNGLNEDCSDYGFSDYVRNTIVESEGEREKTTFFGGRKVVCESADDDFHRRFEEWIRNGKRLQDLEPDSFKGDDENRFRARLKSMISKIGVDIDRDGNGVISQKEMKKYIEDNTDANGKIPTEKLFANGLRNAGYGINNYLNKFMPMSWIIGAEKGIAKGAKKAFKAVGGDKLKKAYGAVGGNKALALGTLGGLAFGPAGIVAGALAGKGLQKLANYGNS